MEGLKEAKADLTVFVHPSRSADVALAVRRQLSSLLFTYDELLDGVLLSHEFRIKDRQAKILPGLTPLLGVKIKARLLLFSPKPDMILEGKVVKIGGDSIHAVVLGFASASILREDIPDEFKYKKKGGIGAFVSRLDKKHAIKVGSMIRFTVKRALSGGGMYVKLNFIDAIKQSTSVDEELIHVNGSLLQPYTGCLRWLSKHWSDDTSHERSKKRGRDSKSKESHEYEDQSVPHKLHKTNSDE